MARTHDFVLPIGETMHQVNVKLKAFGNIEVYIDGQMIAKKMDWFGSVDVLFQFRGQNVAVAKSGRKFRLAMNGQFLDNGEPFLEIKNMPSFMYVGVVLAAVQIVLSIVIVGGFLGAAFGLMAIMLMFNIGRSAKSSTGKKVGLMILTLAVLYIVWLVFAFIVVAAYFY